MFFILGFRFNLVVPPKGRGNEAFQDFNGGISSQLAGGEFSLFRIAFELTNWTYFQVS